MNKFLTIVILGALALVTPMDASETKSAGSSATVAGINSLTVGVGSLTAGEIAALSSDGAGNAGTAQTVAAGLTWTISNNDHDGFTVTIKSTNGSEVRHGDVYSADSAGTFTSYTAQMAAGSGICGDDFTSTPPSSEITGALDSQTMSLPSTHTTFIEITDPTVATIDCDDTIVFDFPAKEGLLEGTYTDTIELVLANK